MMEIEKPQKTLEDGRRRKKCLLTWIFTFTITKLFKLQIFNEQSGFSITIYWLKSLIQCITIYSAMMNHNLNRNNYLRVAASTTAATFFTLIVIFASSTTTSFVTPVEATSAPGNNTTITTMTPSLELEFSSQPVWDETVRTTGIFPINQTHSMATFEGNGTMTVPDTGEVINMTNNGTAFGNIVPQANNTVVSYGRENVFSVDDGDTSAITFFEIIQYDPATFRGNGLVTAVFDNNATGSLAPFNGMLVVGTHEEDPSTRTVTIRLWEWESGIPIPAPNAATTMGGAPLMNTTTTAIDAATVVETNTTSISEGEAEAGTIGGLSEE